ncbi:MAG: mechanosensitive ion channel [Gammaproteobacteria bacterium]|nr:mechanosensitive ion channel [Gammaproteobacteria bacterium]
MTVESKIGSVNTPSPQSWLTCTLHAISIPCLVAFCAGLIYGAIRYYYGEDISQETSQWLTAAAIGLQAILIVIFYWFFIRLINIASKYLKSLSTLRDSKTSIIIIPFLASASKAIALLAMVNLVLPYIGLPAQFEFILEKITSIFVIGCITWIFFRLVHAAEQLIVNYYAFKSATNVTARKMYTQMRILKRVIYGVILILALGASLMLFDNVRSLGASVLTTAGIAGVVLTLAAQRSLPSLLASIEIAVSQPIKIGDAVIIENEFGVVEKINFRYVVIKLWDWRRLVVPTNYFLEKPFQNWSREQATNLIGTTYLYVDYTLPVDVLRGELLNVLKATRLWDGKVNNIQVSDAKQNSMELRILTSARSPAEAWDLRCEVREKLIDFIAKNYPQCLPHQRTTQFKGSYMPQEVENVS